MSLAVKIKYLFNDYSWICAYRKRACSALKINGVQKGFMKIECPKGYWAADPFLFEENEDVYLFVEYTDTKRKKSALAAKKLMPDSDADFTIIYEFPYHASYPCVFEWKGTKYIIPETKSAREICLLECVKWPYSWEKRAVLLKESDSVDSTPFIYKDKLYLMLYEEAQDMTLSVAELDVKNGLISNKVLIKKYDKKVARPGGNIIYDKENVILVRQPGIRFYGEKIQFVKVDYKEENVIEKLINEINPDQIDIEVNGKKIGLHTYNQTINYEVIDIFVKKRNIFKPLLYCLHRARFFGYGEYEKDKKMRWYI